MHLETHLPLLLDLLLKSTVVLALAALLMAAFRRASAANRHAIAVAALVTLLVLPFTKLAQPRWSFALHRDAPAPPVTMKLPPITTVALSETSPGSAVVAPESTPTKAVGIRVNWSAVGVGVWLAGFALVLLHRAGVGLQLRRLAAGSRAMKEGRVLAMTRELAASCGLRAEIRESDTCRVPLAFGVWRPTVLLPGEAMGWSDERLSAALQHEFGHIRRRDCLTRWFADLACAFYWMNPLVWLGARSLRLAQEQACDDLVLNAGTRPDAYATQLVEVVRSLQGDRFTARHALAMAQPSTLETRVLAIVDTQRDRSARSVRGTFAGITFAAAALALCTGAQLRGADEKKAAPPADANAPARQQILIEAKFIEISDKAQGLPDSLKLLRNKDNPAASVIGLLTAEQAADAMKTLNKVKGADLLSAPRITTLSGQQALIEIVREFRYPTEWDRDAKSGSWKPVKFETKNIGVSFSVEAAVGTDVNAGGVIDMQMTPEVVEFNGWRDLDGDAKILIGKPDTSKPLGKRLTDAPSLKSVPEGHRAQPVFNTRKMSASVTVRPEHTVGLGIVDSGDADKAKDGGKEARRVLVVLVTPSIVKPEKVVPAQPKADERGKIEVQSDEITVDKKTGALSASGNVRIETAQAIIKADSAEITPKKQGADAGNAKAEAQWILPKVDFREATMREVVEFLVIKSRTLDAAGKGVNIVLRNMEKIGDVKITLSLTDVPLTEVLRYVAALANCEVVKEDFAFVISPMQAGKAPAPNADRAKGGANAPAVPTPEKPEGAALKKARAIIFPKIDLHEATLSETVDFLRAKSKALDPDKQGVNFILKAGAGESPKITVSLNNVPLSEIIKYVAALARYEFEGDDHAITLRPAAK